MYKLILVDDEAEVREGMRRRVEWEKYGFEVAGEAENGRDALDLLEKGIPDVVVTDISMPVMNGLELAAALRERYPTVKTVILTGYDEFEYARQAIRLGVQDYVLKPVTAAGVGEILEKLRSKIDAEAALMEDMNALRAHFRLSRPVMRERFLLQLALRGGAARTLADKARALAVDLSAFAWQGAAVMIDERTIANTGFRDEDPELALFAVGNIAAELAGRGHRVHVFGDDAHAYVLFCLEGTESGTETLKPSGLPVWTVMESVRASVTRHLGFTVSIGIGRPVRAISEIRTSFDGALGALDYRMIHGGDRILLIEDLEAAEDVAPPATEEDRHALVLALKIGDESGIREALDRLLLVHGNKAQAGQGAGQPNTVPTAAQTTAAAAQSSATAAQSAAAMAQSSAAATQPTPAAFQAVLVGLLAPMMQVAAENRIEASELFEAGDGWMTPLSGGTRQEISAWFAATAVRLGACVGSRRRSQTGRIVSQAIEWVAGHYSDPDLSIGSVSQTLHVSASHFSALFRRETGETFLNHLTQVRMKAARELLAETDMKTVEIASRVGYPDPHYFSYFFKKNMGLSPKEFRAGLKG